MVCGNADLNIINLPNGIKANQKCGGSDNDPEESEVRMIPAICRQCGKSGCQNPAVWRISIENGKEQTVWSCEEHFQELRQTAGIFLGAIKA
jgi:hypothetical protein